MVMGARMFTISANMSDLRGVVKSSTALVRNVLSNLTSLALLLSRGGSSTDREGTEFAERFDDGSVGLIASYCLSYDFLDRVPLTGIGSTIRMIYSSSESVSRLVEVSYFPVPREMT